MLKAISWNQFLSFIGTGVFCWYAYVLLRYFLKTSPEKGNSFSPADRDPLFADAQPHSENNESLSSSGNQSGESAEGKGPQLNLVTQTITQEAQAVILEAAEQGVSEAELAARLQVILSNYPNLRYTAYGIAINDFIIKESRAVGFDVNKEAVVGFWE